MATVELSHVISDGMVTYPGLPAPKITPHMTFEEAGTRYDEGTEFQISAVEMVANTGTYLDTPSHRYRDGFDLAGLPLERCADLDGVVVPGPSSGAVDADTLEGIDTTGKAVLFCTGHDAHWGSDRYFEDHPFLSTETVDRLVESGATLVGIDSLNIDDTSGGARYAHSTLLGAGIPIVEHLTGLDLLPIDGFRFNAVPVRWSGVASFPVRAFAVVP
ncbi:N/A [soil metagenome]